MDSNFDFLRTIEDILNSNVSAGDGQEYTLIKAEFAKVIYGEKCQPAETLYYYALPKTGITSEEELKKALSENVCHKTFMVFEKSINEMLDEMHSAADAMNKIFVCPCNAISLDKISKILCIIYKIKGFDSPNNKED